MTEKYIPYKFNGETYDIPESKSAEFEKNYPSATIEMHMDGEVFDIPLSKKEDAIKQYGSKLTYAFDKGTFDKDEEIVEEEKTPMVESDDLEDAPVADNDRTSLGETIVKGIGAAGVRTGKMALDLARAGWENSVIGGAINMLKGQSFDEKLQDKDRTLTRWSNKLGETADRLSKEADPTGGEQGFVDLLSEGKVGKAFQKALGSGIESLPMMVAAASTPAAIVYGLGMAASQYSDDTQDSPEIASWKRGINALGSSALELAVERIGGPLKNIFSKAGGELTEEAAKEILENVAKEGIESIAKRILGGLKKIGKEGLEEGGEEVLTSFGNDALGQALDWIDGNKDYGITAQWQQTKEQNPDADMADFAKSKAKEYLDSFIGGALSGMQISGTVEAANAVANRESSARNELEKRRNYGGSLDYGDMYDTDYAVSKSIDGVESALSGSSISRDFIDGLSSEEAFALSRRDNLSREQRMAFADLAGAKAIQEGLNAKLDQRLEDAINTELAKIDSVTEFGKVTSGVYNDRAVFIRGGVVDNGKVHIDNNGNDGPIVVVDIATGEVTTVNSNEISAVDTMSAVDLKFGIDNSLRDSDKNNRDIARSTMSVNAKADAVNQYKGRKMMIDLGNGIIEVEVQQVLPESREVIIKGKKGDLGGQSIITIGAGVFYDSISRDNDGNPMFADGRNTTEETPIEPETTDTIPEEPVELPATQPDDIDYRGETVSILINGVPVNVEVISQDGPSDRIVYEYEDENGNVRRGSSSIEDFKAAIQQAQTNSIPEETPATDVAPVEPEEPAAPVEDVPLTPEDINWDALFDQDPEAYFTELQKQFGDGAIDILNGEIDAVQKEIDALNKNRGKTMNDRMNNLRAISALRLRLGILNEMIERLTPASAPTVEAPHPEPQQSVAEETPTAPEVPVDETPTEETPTQTTNEQGFIIEDGFVINPVVLEMPGSEGTPNRIFLAEKDGKWGFNQHAVLDDGNESGSANAKIQVENIRYNSKEEAIAAALSYFDFYKNLKKNSPSTALDAFTQYIRQTYLGQTPTETEVVPEPAPVETTKPVAPTQIDNPIREAQKREKSLATQLKRIGIPHEQKQDMAFNAGKAIADMFATRDEYEAYAENATDFGDYNADFERGVDESFANRNQNISETPVNSVPLENEPKGEDNGGQGEIQGPADNGQGISDNGGQPADEGAEGGNQTAPKVGKGKARKSEKVADKYPARKGNATQKILVDTFGFSQVTIPNSRKEILNSIYDFMMEMSKMLGISPKSIGQGGWLGISNLRANSNAKARYQMRYGVDGIKETNLNLKYGKLSSIAHEWWHALDHTLVFFESGRGIATITEVRESAFDGRKETLDAVRQVMQAIKDSGHVDRMRKLPYHSQSYINYLLEPTELGARAFNEYILMKFAEAGIVVDGIVEEDYPSHPTPEEMAVIAPAFDNLFKVLKEKEGKNPGTSVLYHIGEEMDGNDEVKQELGMLVADWIKQGGNFVVMDSAEMQQALADEGISQEAKRPRRTIFNRNLSSAEKLRIQKYIVSLPQGYVKDRPYLLMTRNYAYVFNTLPSRYEENTTQRPIGDGFEILHKVNIRALTAAERQELERRYNNDEERRTINEWLQAAGNVVRGLPVSVSDSSNTGTGAGYDSMADTEHREEARANGADNSSLRNTGEVQKLETPDGVIFGFVKNGVVYLDPTLINPNTSIHEYTHLWDNALMQLNPALWERGKALMKQTPIWDEVVNDPNYADIKDNEDLVASEVHSRLVGKDGAELLSQLEQQAREEGLTKGAKNLSILGRLREWLNEATQWLKDAFTSVWSKDEIEAVTLTDFLNMPLRDLANFTVLPTVESSIIQRSMSTEMAAIKEEAIANGTFMKAPNGMPTKLNERQWLQVRTQNFINWFGDWINDPENASKVIDENGEPLVVYHGSPYGAITEFNRKGHSVSGLKEFGTFFGTNKKLAQLYAYARQQAKGDIEKYELEKARLDAIIYNDETPARIALDAFDELDKLEESQKPKVYEVFLNIRNPKVFDAEYSDGWNGWHKLTQDVGYDIKSGIEAIEAISGHNRAAIMDQKYDGIIAKNIADIHSDSIDNDLMGDVFLVFDETPENIKSATGNVGTFNPLNTDIRYRGYSAENSVSLQNDEYTGETYADNDSRGRESEVEGIQREASVSGSLSEGRRLARPENGKVPQDANSRFNPISKREGESDRQRNNRASKFLSVVNNLTSDEKIKLYAFLKDYMNSPSGVLRSRVIDFVTPIRQNGNSVYADFVEDFINDELKYREGVSASTVAKHGIFVGVKQNLSVIERMFYAFNNDEYNSVLFDRVFNLAKRFGVSVKFATRKEDGSFFTGYGNYNPNENTITLDANLLVKGNESELCQTILHELIHSVVARAASIMSGRAVDNNKQFIDPKSLPQDVVDGINILKEVYESIKDDGTFQDTYGKKDFEEMLSEISDPKFRALLKAKKLWKKFINGICQILGIADTSASESDALTEIESALDKILSSSERGELDSAYASYLGQLADGYTLEDLNRLESGPVKTMLTQNVLNRTSIDPTEVARESAKSTYDRVVNETWQEFQRQFQDAMQPVRIAIDAIQQETGNIPIEDYENYLLIQNQASSRSRVEIDDFARRYYSPIIEQLNRMIDMILEARSYDKHDKSKRAEVYAEIRQYLIAKHGLERNEYYQTHKMRKLTASEKRREINNAKDNYDNEVNNINADATLTDAERELALRDAKDAFDAAITEINTREVPDIRDYSGLTALFGLEPKKFEEAEEEARKLVDDFETSIAGIDADAVNDLWAKINKATDKTLKHSYESGMLSRQQYNDIKAMFQFYIPLRGFDETTAEDVYSYARFEGNRFNPAVQTAKGRTSIADDPIAIIMNMAESEIAQGNKNRAKQALYNFILNRPVTDAEGNQRQNSLMRVESVWYEAVEDAEGNVTYRIATPDHESGETYEEFENRMQALAAEDKAQKSKKGNVDIGMRFQKQQNIDAHYVYLKVNGVEKAIYINGDPKTSEAINGTYRPKPIYEKGSVRTKSEKINNVIEFAEENLTLSNIHRIISSTFTNYSPEFTVRNFFRDLGYSHINIDIKEKDPAYRKKFRQNWRHNNIVRVWTMLKAYRAGEYDGVALNEDQASFVEFMKNGGQTGYTVINSVENHKRELDIAIRNIQKGIDKGGVKDSTIFKYTLGAIEFLNEVSEIVTRFAAYKTSRDMGRGVVTAINNAKEITVNFNTKGAQDGRGVMGWIAKYFGWSKFFFNASVQGVQNIGAMAQANKLKFCGTVGGVIAAGFLVPAITSIINALFGDDEEEYWNIPEYDRQNNLCIVVGDRYAKIPLPIGFREVYAIGDMVAAMAFNKKFSRDVKQVGTDIANKIASVVLPINPLESTANGLSFWQMFLYTTLPSTLQVAIQNATNTDWKGTPLQKEYTYNENDPQWMKAFASNPDWMVGLSKWCNEHINLDGNYTGWDWSPEKLDNTLSNVFGGIYSLIKKTGRSISMIWNEEQRNMSNIPLAGVVVGSDVGEDDRFITDAYFDMKEYYDDNIKNIKTTAGAFGLSLDDVFVNKDGAHHPKMQEIYSNKNFDFMQEWYLGDDILQNKNRDIKNLEKKINAMEEPSLMDVEELAILKKEYDIERRDFVNDMLELD